MSEKQYDKLTKICARLSSPHGGERAAAALLASEMIQEMGVDWSSLITAGVRSVKIQSLIPKTRGVMGDHVPLCEALLVDHEEALNDWDVEFLTGLATTFRLKTLSAKQRVCLNRILAKALPEAAQ